MRLPAGCHAEPAGEGKLTILIEGVFTPKAKKAFKRRRIDRDGIERAFDEAQTANGWLIFYTHDVADEPSPYGCTPALLRHALEAAAHRQIPAMSVANALQRAGA